LAELAYHWSLLTPWPTKPAEIHRIRTQTGETLRLIEGDLRELGVDMDAYESLDYARCQEIGMAVGFLEYDGLIAASARWQCDNLILFSDNHSRSRNSVSLEVLQSNQVDWLDWARSHGIV